MTLSTATREREACLLFGSQCEDLHQNVAYIRAAVDDDPKLLFLAKVIDELREVWPRIEESWPRLAHIGGIDQLAALRDLFTGKTSLSSMSEVKATNLLLTPVTVARQLVEFYELKSKAHHPALYWPSQNELRIVDAQGFCVGMLAAITVSCSNDKFNFREIASNAIRLAVCIGALVDLDDSSGDGHQSIVVRWKSQPELELLQQLLKENGEAYISCFSDANTVTVTLPCAMTGSMMEIFRSYGLKTRPISLFGRFHHPVHHEGVHNILGLCSRNGDFQLPSSEALILPFRSNFAGEIVKNKMLHAVALEGILIKQCNWWQTVSELSTSETTLGFMSIGPGQFVPRAVYSQIIETRRDEANGLPNGEVHYSSQIMNATPTEENLCTLPPMSIAITGMAGRYPNADTLEQLWEMLEQGKRAVQQCPGSRFKIHKIAREPQGPFWGNYLASPDIFDNRFFNISSREAENMDPQQRLLLEVAYEAMESAGFCGLRSDQLPRDIGCYVGVGADDYTENVGSQHANAFSATGTLQAFNTGRVSHYFGWTGPSVVVDTACSSSAVAIHLACTALQTRDCSIAVAGGVNVMTSPRVTQNLAAASFLSPSGASKAFDAAADGYCRGEGAGLVVLRPLQEAIRNNDPILAVITGTAVNQGSNCSPITVPHSKSQQALYREALLKSNMDPYQVTYVEAHGTGTQVGDPIEFHSIREAFGNSQRAEKLYVGSIKDNIGHVETGSGIAGLLKTVLMMHKQKIPKQANFTQLNPAITPPPAQDQMEIPTQSVSWKAERRVALVTNYGAAGSNAAMVVQEYSKPGVKEKKDHSVFLPEVPIFISARTKDSLNAYCSALEASITHVQPGWTTWDLAYNLAVKQNRNMEFCTSFTVPPSHDIILSRLQSISSESSAEIQKQPSSHIPVILSFGGQSGNTAHISQELFNNCTLLRNHLTDCDQVGRTLGLPPLFPAIFQADPIEDIVDLHHRLFSIQYASAKSWLDSGLHVDRMIGHSFGQLTALCIADCLSLFDALSLIIERARLIQSSWGPQRGVMIAVEATETQIELLLNRLNCMADVACVNNDCEWVIAGDEASIQAIEQTVASDQSSSIRIKRLRNTHAFHSRLVDSIMPGLMETARTLEYRPLSIPIEFCSPADDLTCITPETIAQHSRMPVYFRDAVRRILTRIQGPAVWLEAGSASPVISMVRRVLENPSSSSTTQGHFHQAVDLGGSQALANLAKITSRLWRRGVSVQFWPFHSSQHAEYNWVSLPPYQFSQNRHWVDYDPTVFAPSPQQASPLPKPAGLLQLLEKNQDEQLFALNTKDRLYQLCTQGHAVVDQSLCPASMYIALALQATESVLETDLSRFMVNVEDLTFSAPLVLNPSGRILLRLSQKGRDQWLFSLFGVDDQETTVVHANGTVSVHSFDKPSSIMHRFNSLGRLVKPSQEDAIVNASSVSGFVGPAVYQAFERVTNYADFYRGVHRIFASGHEAMANVSPPQSFSHQTVLDPILFDNFLQVAGLHVNCLSEQDVSEVFVCTGAGEILLGENFMQRNTNVSSWAVYTNYTRPSSKQVVCDIFVTNRQTGALAVAIMSVSFTGVSIQSLTRTLAKLENKGNTSLTETGVEHVVSRTLADTNGTLPRSPPHSDTPVSVDENGNIREVQEMLRDLLGVELEELSPSCSLNDIGIDSLMQTEVLSEITKRFKVTITSSNLAEIVDIKGLVKCIFPGSPNTQSITNTTNPKLVSKVDATLRALPHTPKSDISEEDDAAPLALIAHSCFKTCKSDTVHSHATKWAGFCESVYPMQRALVTAYIVEAFRALGYPLEALQPKQAVPEIQVLPRHERLKKQLYHILDSSEIISETSAGSYCRTGNPVPISESHNLHGKMHQWPQHRSELELLRTTGPFLADCLTGKADGLKLIFQDAAARRLLEDVYTNAPMFKSATMHLAQYLVDIARNLGSQREIHILEIGAGTGGTTMYLLEQLTAIPGIRLKYTFTDLSASLITLARKKFSAYDFMRYEILDISKPPSAGLQGQFDIVLSSNCIHATENIIESCTNINALLRPNGIVCLIELTQNLSWFDLVFGLLEGWWLFSDGRQHALASAQLWDRTMRQAGMKWVDWTHSKLPESEFLRVIVASPSDPLLLAEGDGVSSVSSVLEETVVYSEEDGIPLQADIYYPETHDDGKTLRPIALMIHGGGHILLSRKDIRPPQTQTLLNAGFLPISIDYRLCPEISLLDGPMHDACKALRWIRQSLSNLPLCRSDIRPDSSRVVAVGWSSGGHLAMTLAWTAPAIGVQPPEAILAFYCATDYEDPFWYKPNFPFGSESMMDEIEYNVDQGMYDKPITAYNPSRVERAKGGWMAPSDPRSLIALHMNWKGLTLPFLLSKWKHRMGTSERSGEPAHPTEDEVKAASPLAQIRDGHYKSPTFLIHGTLDDLIPHEQSMRTYRELLAKGIEAEIRVLEGEVHLFDIYPGYSKNLKALKTVDDGYRFLQKHAQS